MIQRSARDRQAGFTLLETMLAVALMGAIVISLGELTGQWMPNWRRGFADLQRADLLSAGLERIVADVSGAEYVSPKAARDAPLFDGRQLSLVFVHDSAGPNEAPHLEYVRLAETVDARGFALVRTRAPFTPGTLDLAAHPPDFADPVVLARAPFRISFAYADPSRVWRDVWPSGPQLPQAVRVTVRDAASQQVLAASTVVTLKVTAPPPEAAQAVLPPQPGQNDANVAPMDGTGTPPDGSGAPQQ